MRIGIILLSATMLLAGCASDRTYREGERLVTEGQTEEGLKMLAEAVREQPNKVEYRAALVRAREQFVARLLREGDAALKAEQFDLAEQRYKAALAQHPENQRALAGLAGMDLLRRNRVAYSEAQAAFVTGEFDAAASLLRGILVSEPDYADAAALLRKVDDRTGRNRGAELPRLASFNRKPVTLEFRDVPLKFLFDGISQQSGLNFVFDKDVRTDTRSTVFARNTPLVDVLDMLLASSQLAKKVLNEYTLLIYPNTPAKQEEYREVVVRGFFLANADPKQTMQLLRSIARIRDVHVDEKLNMVVVRDSPEAIRLAEKLVKMADRAEPEVMLQVEILEIKRSKLLELGVQWPNQFSVLSKQEQETVVYNSSGDPITTNKTWIDAPLTLESLRHITRGKIGISPTLGIIANKTDGDVNILANPRIRVRNKEKAKIHIGDKVPVITSNVTSTGVTSESVSYLDVGLKLDVEPQVYLDSEVAMKVGLEVSNIVQQIKSSTGTLTYQLGSRNANTVLRLKDGETQVLAGLISDEERSSATKVPGLGDLPLIGRLFSSNSDSASKTEIVLLITPHIIRNVIRPELAEGEFFANPAEMSTGQPTGSRSGTAGTSGSSMEPFAGRSPAAPQPYPGQQSPAAEPFIGRPPLDAQGNPINDGRPQPIP